MKKIIVALALLICASSATLIASDVSDAKRSLKSAQKELSSVTTKRNKAQQKQEQLLADYEEAQAKVAANQDKPKSLAYKDAVKKSEALPAKIEENAKLLAALNRQVDSLQNVVSGCESALSQVQEAETSEDVARVESKDETPVVSALEDPALQPVEKEDKDDAIVLSNESRSKESSPSEDEASSSSKPTTFWGKVWRVIKIIFWIIVGIIALVIFMKIGGRSSSHSGSSSKSAAQRDKEAKQRQIASYQRDIANLKVKIARCQDNYRRSKSKQELNIMNSYKIQIQEIKAKIASLK